MNLPESDVTRSGKELESGEVTQGTDENTALPFSSNFRDVVEKAKAEGATSPKGLQLLSDPTALLSPPQAGDELGRLGTYRVLRLLGKGGMGFVFEAEDTQLKRRVALKTIKPLIAANPLACQRFLREARSMAALRHDHVVTIYQVGEDRGIPFFAMELLEGCSLAERLTVRKKLPVAEVIRLGVQIAKGLEAAHKRGLIHRDIKPDNVWLDAHEGERVKLLDFGLARAAEEEGERITQEGMVIGTPAYMAPEQGRGDPVDPRTDLFSLGTVLYRSVTGELPFQGKDTIATLLAVAHRLPAAPERVAPEVPGPLSRLILKLLEKEPNNRYQSAQEVQEALLALDKELSAAVQPVSLVVPVVQPIEPVPVTPLAEPTTPAAPRAREPETPHRPAGTAERSQDTPEQEDSAVWVRVGAIVLLCTVLLFAIVVFVVIRQADNKPGELTNVLVGLISPEEKIEIDERLVDKWSSKTMLIDAVAFGMQLHGPGLPPELRRLPTTYYHRQGPFGVIMERYNWSAAPWEWPNATYHADARLPAALVALASADLQTAGLPLSPALQCWSEPPLAVVGVMGPGTHAAYARPYQFIDFYEPSTKVIETSRPAAGAKPVFTYLKDAEDRGANVRVFQGPPRETFAAKAPDGFYHVVIIEPGRINPSPSVDLMSREAMELYGKKSVLDVVLCFHTSNRHFELDRAVATTAAKLGWPTRVGQDQLDMKTKPFSFTSQWAMVTPRAGWLRPFLIEPVYNEAGVKTTYQEEARKNPFHAGGVPPPFWFEPVLGDHILTDGDRKVLERYLRR